METDKKEGKGIAQNFVEGTDLRRRAEDEAREMEALEAERLSPGEALRLLHELRVHQIELEMQNEELRRIQDELEISRARYVDLYDFAPVGYVILNRGGMIAEANLTLAALLGVPRGSLINEPLTRSIVGEDQDAYYLFRKELLESDEKRVCELRLSRKDSSPFWACLEGVPVGDEEGGRRCCRIIVSDITERKKAEQELLQSEARFRTLLQQVPTVAVQGYGADGTVQYWNKASEELYGYTAGEAMGRSLVDLIIPEEMREEVRREVKRMVETGEPTPASELRLARKDGSPVDVFSSHAVVRGRSGQPELFCMDFDLTERKKAEAKIAAALGEKEILLREVHHRVKNNMQVIVSLLRLYSFKIDDAGSREVFKECQDRIVSMALIHEALYGSESLSRIDFGAYLERLCQELGRAHKVSGQRIVLKANPGEVLLGMDQGVAVGMVVCELVGNAFKHAFPGGERGTVSIELSGSDEGDVELVVADDGAGLPPDVDIHGSPSMGLQLAVATVKSQLGGTIRAKGDGGARFVIRFKGKK